MRPALLVAIVVALGAGAIAGFRATTARRARSDFQKRWAELDQRALAPVWSCLFGKEVDVAQLAHPQQARRLIEAAYGEHKETFARALTERCLPAVAEARQAAAAALIAPPPAAAATVDSYQRSLGELESALPGYARRLAGRPAVKEVDEGIVEAAQAWAQAPGAGTPSSPYLRFLTCAVPGLNDLANTRAVYERISNRCFNADPLPFMKQARTLCAPLLRGDAAATTLPLSHPERFADPGATQAAAWDSCSDIARAQQRMADAAALLAAMEHYLDARPAPRPAVVSAR